MQEPFTGDRKNSDYFLRSFDQAIIQFLLPFVPSKISTIHLTMMTLFWSGLIVVFGYFANHHIKWMILFSLCIFLQHVTDMLDGAVGRSRNEGYVKWGFYMDHFLDYIFLCAVVVGYSFLLPDGYSPLVYICIAACGGFMVHFFLDFAITREFKISFNQFGSSEIRYVLIGFNVILIMAGKELLAFLFPFVVGVFVMTLTIMVYQSQKIYSSLDRERIKS